MKNATELLVIYRAGKIIGLVLTFGGVYYLVKKLNSMLIHIDCV